MLYFIVIQGNTQRICKKLLENGHMAISKGKAGGGSSPPEIKFSNVPKLTPINGTSVGSVHVRYQICRTTFEAVGAKNVTQRQHFHPKKALVVVLKF
jgi:hypothetical protein